ncbi:hypothetical protein O0I10_008726 [Lichtheimia ornata]|uniref:Uncharacterized protein n=1 Tax=Lichtheimia ornata TaxID=688661 RepID=A0AAD7UZT4_9FUNG|nr:uncharacterized protein O0I10_008726 [Lichtheimia ornata]KAJ8655637.1 hypothetical protein O0I10_008726 [Lichtheimia ornata]
MLLRQSVRAKRPRSTMSDCHFANKRAQYEPKPIVYGMAKNGAEMRIQLDDKEANICELLRQVSDYVAAERPDLPRIESRIAGGWVRDKLLGKDCHDLDIAVNDMMGYEFAQYVNKCLEKNGYPTRNIAKIDSNPAKSKHLETATTKLFNIEVDFANLRTEVYDDDSRIPSAIAFGTPTEDAYRRDTTINSLFYNINTCQVEDFTGTGLSDLEQGLIRTPLEPFETFRDDPLRVLRCVRFASRFNFELVPEIVDAVKNETIRRALDEKISKERIGNELEKMVTGPLPLKAIEMIHDLGLYNVIFATHANIVSGTVQDSSIAVRAVGVIQWLAGHPMEALRPYSKDEMRLLNMASYFLPFSDIITEQKGRHIVGVQDVLRDSIKATKSDMTCLAHLFSEYPSFTVAVDSNMQNTISRQELGMLIRGSKELWTTTLKLALVVELLKANDTIDWRQPYNVTSDQSLEFICEKYNALISQTLQYGISDCYKWKPMLDGKKIAQILGIKPGPSMGDLLQQTMKWQLANPEGTQEECSAMIKAYWEAGQQSSS